MVNPGSFWHLGKGSVFYSHPLSGHGDPLPPFGENLPPWQQFVISSARAGRRVQPQLEVAGMERQVRVVIRVASAQLAPPLLPEPFRRAVAPGLLLGC